MICFDHPEIVRPVNPNTAYAIPTNRPHGQPRTERSRNKMEHNQKPQVTWDRKPPHMRNFSVTNENHNTIARYDGKTLKITRGNDTQAHHIPANQIDLVLETLRAYQRAAGVIEESEKALAEKIAALEPIQSQEPQIPEGPIKRDYSPF